MCLPLCQYAFLKVYGSFASVLDCVSVLFWIVFYLSSFIFIMFLGASLYPTQRHEERVAIDLCGWGSEKDMGPVGRGEA